MSEQEPPHRNNKSPTKHQNREKTQKLRKAMLNSADRGVILYHKYEKTKAIRNKKKSKKGVDFADFKDVVKGVAVELIVKCIEAKNVILYAGLTCLKTALGTFFANYLYYILFIILLLIIIWFIWSKNKSN